MLFLIMFRGLRDPLNNDMKASMELMNHMNIKGCSESMCQEISDWRVRHTEHDEDPPVVAVKASVLNDFLMKCYNMEGTLPFEVPIYLPKSKENINLCCHDATAQLIDTLTDPRITLDDCLFWNGDPESAPPEEFVYLNDINSG